MGTALGRRRMTTWLKERALLLAVLVLPTLPALGDELEARAAIGTAIRFHLDNGEFDVLEKMHEQFIQPSERTASGSWKLELYYNNLSQFPGESVDPVT